MGVSIYLFSTLAKLSKCIRHRSAADVYLLNPRSQETPHKELESLKLCLYNDELEIRLRIHIPRLVFHKLNLRTISQPNTLATTLLISLPSSIQSKRSHIYVCHTCLLILSSTLSIKASGHAKSSGATRSVTHARVNACKSRVSCGSEWAETSASRSSISMIVV